jgi:G:T-mismatch repair DNA endonuclease (very short patch repair protein)
LFHFGRIGLTSCNRGLQEKATKGLIFVDKTTKHIIEVYGDYWHCNPKVYDDNYIHPYYKMTAQQKRKLDEERKQYLESLGYYVTVVWESDMEEFIGTLK